MELGEKFSKYPLENDSIKENFDDDLSDIPYAQRERIKMLYKFDLQPKLDMYTPYLALLKKNAEWRIEHNKNYQAFLKELKEDQSIEPDETETEEQFGKNDLQLTETYNIMKDLILMMNEKKQNKPK
jgi:carboxyl-terminal processing protease